MGQLLAIEKDAGQIEEWMMKVLLVLMEKRTFGAIRVKEITDKAKLARCTFAM